MVQWSKLGGEQGRTALSDPPGITFTVFRAKKHMEGQNDPLGSRVASFSKLWPCCGFVLKSAWLFGGPWIDLA